MSRSPRRIALTPGYLLHHYPWRDTSRILEVLTREHGRVTLFARGVRGPGAKLAPVLQPFQLLLLSFSGRGEAAQLTGAERAAAAVPLQQQCLLAGFYLNELLLKLTTRHDPLPELFDHYHGTTIRGLTRERPFLHVIGLRRPLEEWGRRHGLRPEWIQPEKRRQVAHYDVFGTFATDLISRFASEPEPAP